MGGVAHGFLARRAPTTLPAFVIGAALLYTALLRTRLIPRWLTIWGLLGVARYAAGSVLCFFGVKPGVGFLLEMVLAPQEMVMAAWLVI